MWSLQNQIFGHAQFSWDDMVISEGATDRLLRPVLLPASPTTTDGREALLSVA
jgi:hypothetical protein